MSMTTDASLAWRPSLEELLCLRPVGAGAFLGEHHHLNARGVIFGGQMLGQALVAAASVILAEESVAHTLRVDFLRAGLGGEPLCFDAQVAMGGRSVTSVQVTGRQGSRLVVQATVSFQRRQAGPEYQRAMPGDAGDPEALPDLRDVLRRHAHRVDPGILASVCEETLDVRLCDGESTLFEGRQQQDLRYWIRARQALPDQPRLHQAALAYLSDFWFSLAAMWPMCDNKVAGEFKIVSLNHSVWFHAPVRAHEWLLVEASSPFSGGGRSLTLGSVHRRDGVLSATLAQEALYRA